MKKQTFYVVALLLLAATSQVHAQDDAMMKAWMSYMTPSEAHRALAKDNGTWNEEVTLWMTPGAEPVKSQSICENTMIMGGRYQQSIHKGTMMGMPFEGMGLLAYDNAKKVFINNWIDNMGTGMMNMEGTWDAASKSITFKGKCVDPTTGKDILVRQVMKVIDSNNQTVEMYNTNNGKEMKTMEIKMTRKN